MDLLIVFGGSGVALLVVCLITRELTEQRLRNLRTELMTLRSQLRTLEDRVTTFQQVRSQVRETLQRIDSRKLSTVDSIENIYDKLRQVHRIVREEEMPELEEEDAEREAAEVEA